MLPNLGMLIDNAMQTLTLPYPRILLGQRVTMYTLSLHVDNIVNNEVARIFHQENYYVYFNADNLLQKGRACSKTTVI